MRRSPAQGAGASDRVGRMLNIVPWIAAHDGPLIDDVCTRFGVTRRRLIDDLNVLQLVGLPPYTPDMLTEVTISGDRVWVRLADVFSRPLRLTPDQALGLIAAGKALAAAPASPPAASDAAAEPGSDVEGPLSTGLAKLASLLGIDAADAVTIRLGTSDPGVLQALSRGVQDRRRVRLDYFSYGRDERTTREVDPYRVFSEAGAWYLHGHCHLAGEPRLFRVDRIFAVDELAATFERPASAEEMPPVFHADPDTPRVTLLLAAAARWVAGHYPVEETVQLPDGGLRVRLAVSSRGWLEKLLLRLGPDAQVLEATDRALMDTGPAAARRVLARYEVG